MALPASLTDVALAFSCDFFFFFCLFHNGSSGTRLTIRFQGDPAWEDQMEGSYLLPSLGLVSSVSILYLWASLWSTEVGLQADRRKGFLIRQGSLSGDDVEEKEEERSGKEQAKGWRESAPSLSGGTSPQLTSICETHPLGMLALCWQGAELYGYANVRKTGSPTRPVFQHPLCVFCVADPLPSCSTWRHRPVLFK